MKPAPKDDMAEFFTTGNFAEGEREEIASRGFAFLSPAALGIPQKKPVKGGGVPLTGLKRFSCLKQGKEEVFFEEEGFVGPPATTGL